MHRYLKEVIASGWMKLLSNFPRGGVCANCTDPYTHVWFDRIRCQTYVMCVSCRDSWIYLRRQEMKRRDMDKVS